MKRLKWFRTDWPISMRDIGLRLESSRFKSDASDGFVLDRVRDDTVEGRYFERHIIQDHTTDPFGTDYRSERIEFEQWRFRLTDSQPGFELIGSTRGSRALANKLAEICDFRLSITDFTVDLMNWLYATVEETGCDGFVDIIQIGSIDLDNGAIGRSTVTGRSDVKDAVQKLVGSRSYSLLKLRFKTTGKNPGTITLSNTASAAIKFQDTSEIENGIRLALQRS